MPFSTLSPRRAPAPAAIAMGEAAMSWSRMDAAVLAALCALAAVAVALGFSWRSLPAEDALMLMRYARNLAGGHGIVWNVGEHPVEGATDFLFLVTLSGWMKLSGLHAVLAARTLLAACQVAGVGLLYWAARRIAGAAQWTAAFCGIYLALGPGITQVANGFSGTFYGLLALCAWCAAVAAVRNGSTWRRAIGFAIFALLTGLTRPDGVFLAAFMLAALVFALRKSAWQVLAATVAVFAVLGGAYFLWRVHYFGHLLPNAYYKKGAGKIYPGSLRVAAGNVFRLLMPCMPVFLIALLARRCRRLAIFGLIPLAGFTAIWILLTAENNTGMRFQYPVVPLGLLSAALVAHALLGEARAEGWQAPRHAISKWAAAALVLCGTVGIRMYWRTQVESPQLMGTGAFHIAQGMAAFQDHDYTVATTEAGVIPYFSGWRALDTYGLNDEQIVHNPHGVTAEYLDRYRPAVVEVFVSSDDSAHFQQIWREQAPAGQTLDDVRGQTAFYAASRGYALAARWGVTPCAVNIWYVRRDVPEFDALMGIIQQTPHFYPYGDGLAQNFMAPEPPPVCEDQTAVLGRRD